MNGLLNRLRRGLGISGDGGQTGSPITSRSFARLCPVCRRKSPCSLSTATTRRFSRRFRAIRREPHGSSARITIRRAMRLNCSPTLRFGIRTRARGGRASLGIRRGIVSFRGSAVYTDAEARGSGAAALTQRPLLMRALLDLLNASKFLLDKASAQWGDDDIYPHLVSRAGWNGC